MTMANLTEYEIKILLFLYYFLSIDKLGEYFTSCSTLLFSSEAKDLVMNVSCAMWCNQYFDWVYFNILQYNFQALTRPYVSWHDVFIVQTSETFVTTVDVNISCVMWRDQYFDWVNSSFPCYNFKALTRPYVRWRDVFIAQTSETFMSNDICKIYW